MSSEPVDSLLAYLDDNISVVSEVNFDRLSQVINQFQQDPQLLTSHRNGKNTMSCYILYLTEGLFEDCHNLLWRAKIFYNLSKVITWKKIASYLPTNVYQLPQLLAILPNIESEESDDRWYISYMILSWVYVLVLSPFKLEKSSSEIHRITLQYDGYQSLKVIVSHIRAQLFVKNSELFNVHKYEMDPFTLNCYLKVVKCPIDKELLSHFTQQCLHDTDTERNMIINLKLLPKLFKMNARYKDWELMEDIISWFLSNMNNPFTTVRFTLAHSFSKIVKCLVSELGETEAAHDLIETRINDSFELIKSTTSWDLIDSDLLHTNLLILAELSSAINENWPQLFDTISTNILSSTSKFQQLRINNIRGSQIRDASNFICWSIARTNRGAKVADKRVMTSVFINLLMCSTFDRDLLVRRSANAALQEILGRYISPMKILDNMTILKIIELPIINLAETYSMNLLALYDLFSADGYYHEFLEFLIAWLVDYNLIQNHDLKILDLTIESLHNLILKRYQFLDPLIVSKLRSCTNSTVHHKQTSKSVRILSLLTRLSRDDILTDVASFSNMSSIYENYKSSLKLSSNHTNDDLFGFSTIFRYWLLNMEKSRTFSLDEETIKIFFHIVRAVPDRDNHIDNFTPLVKSFISKITSQEQVWENEAQAANFWSKFENFIRLNNSLVCSALPELPPKTFQVIFYRVLASMDCTRKSRLINSLSDRLAAVVNTNGEGTLFIIANLLNDYTITQQGDVGRYVRISAAKVIAKNVNLFYGMQNEQLTSLINSSLARLCAEQVEELKILSLKILCKLYDYNLEINKKELNSQLIKFQHVKLKEYRADFWKGYLVSAGAIHFTDSEVTDAIDQFLKFYYSILQEERLELCNCLIRVIPSAKEVADFQKSGNRDERTGCVKQDLLKVAVTHLNFWKRIMESGIQIDPKFNFKGVYAKLYNLHLLGNNLLKVTVIKLFPHLIASQNYSQGAKDRHFTNTIIRRLLTLLQREAGATTKHSPGLQGAIFEALAQIYLDLDALRQFEKIISISKDHDKILQLSESEILV